MIEVVGDSSRDGEWALVRLAVDGERIVHADAPGLARPLEGLTLLEAAAVTGDELAVDALASALGPVFRAAPDRERVAVAMSGGVDSAVALLRAGPQAVGVTLRLWLDPDGPDASRACCSPAAVLAARRTCHELGLPHVTLDARDDFRDGHRRSLRPGLRARRHTEPVHALQRPVPLRRAPALRPARRCRPPRHRPLRAHRPSRRHAAGRARSRRCQGPVLHARHARPGHPRPPLVSARRPDKGRDPRRCRACAGWKRQAGPTARRPASSPAGTTGRSWSAVGLCASRGRFSTRPDGSSAATTASGASPRGSAAASAWPPPSRCTHSGPSRARTPSSSALARRSQCRSVTVRGRLHVPVTSAGAKLRAQSPLTAAEVESTERGFRLRLAEPVYGVARGQTAVLYDG